MKKLKVLALSADQEQPEHVAEAFEANKFFFGSYIYLHGELEDLNGFDCVIFPDIYFIMDQTMTSERQSPLYVNELYPGVYPVEVTITTGEIVDATLYYWQAKDFDFDRGYIVLPSDKESVKQAKTLYKNKANSI